MHYGTGIGDTKDISFFVVAESPEIGGLSGSTNSHDTWRVDAERIIRNAFDAQKQHLDKVLLQAQRAKLKADPRAKLAPCIQATNLKTRYTFAIRCNHDKPTKAHIECCKPFILEELLEYSKPGKIVLIFALGPSIFRALGVKFKKYGDLQGKFMTIDYAGRKIAIFASLSKRQLLAKSGFFGIVEKHIETFFDVVLDIESGAKTVAKAAAPLSELIERYQFPKTLDEVRKLIEYIMSYTVPGRDPATHIISIDTETNTRYPHRKKLKILSLIIAWGNGLSCSIPVEHRECPWSFDDVFPIIQQLLNSLKPKAFQNAKFDYRVLLARGFTVNRVAWDTMLGEHLLEEDKRGFYGLKAMTSQWLPRYAGYEDDLTAIRAVRAAEVEAERKDTGVKLELKGAAKKLYEDDGFADIELKPLNEYGAVDGDVTRRMAIIQQRRIAEEELRIKASRVKLSRYRHPDYQKAAQPGTTIENPLLNLMRNHLIPATLVLAEMESHGMAVDREYTEKMAVMMSEDIVVSRVKLMQMLIPGSFPNGFNPDSPKQLQTLFFATGYTHPETGEPVTYEGVIPEEELVYTDSGQLSTSAAVLRKLKKQYKCAFAKELLHYRGVTKARNTFIANILSLSEEDGRMHTTFHIPGTATGRLSSSDENMQNIPQKIGKYNIKKIFIPSRSGLVIVNADAKAAEVRIYAAYSQDPNLIRALSDGMDPHSFFAATVYDPKAVLQGVPQAQQKLVLETIGIDEDHAWNYDDFQNRDAMVGTEERPGPNPDYGNRLDALRKNIKRVVFGILYGASKYKIASIVGIPDEQAQAIIDVLFRMFPTIPEYIAHTELQVEQLQMVETFLGRRRRFNLRGMTSWMRSKAKRQAVNFKIQSTASEIVIDTLCAINPEIKDLGGQMLITVHDSLVFEIPPESLPQIPALIQRYGVDRVAKKYPWLPVPFSWDIEVGPSYGELQSIESYLAEAQGPQLINVDDVYEEHEIRQEFANNPELEV